LVPNGPQQVRVKVKLGFKNFYVFSAMEPRTGENFSLILPQANTEMMTLFLEKLSKEYAPENLTLVMDEAGWHHSKKLLIPQNIKIVLRPPLQSRT